MLTSEKNKNARKLRSNFGFSLAMNSPQGIRASVILNLSFNIHVDKRKKQKYPQIAPQFWVFACHEHPQGIRGSVILNFSFNMHVDKRKNTLSSIKPLKVLELSLFLHKIHKPHSSMAFEHKIEVLKSIEPDVHTFIADKMNLPEECWQPTDFIPNAADADFMDQVRVLQESIAQVPDTVMVSLIGNMITEEALPSYQTFFNLLEGVNVERNVASTSAWARWSRLWTAEENRHGDLLNKYLYLSGRVDMREVEMTIQRLIHNGIDVLK